MFEETFRFDEVDGKFVIHFERGNFYKDVPLNEEEEKELHNFVYKVIKRDQEERFKDC